MADVGYLIYFVAPLRLKTYDEYIYTVSFPEWSLSELADVF